MEYTRKIPAGPPGTEAGHAPERSAPAANGAAPAERLMAFGTVTIAEKGEGGVPRTSNVCPIG